MLMGVLFLVGGIVLVPFAVALWHDGTVRRWEGALLVVVGVGLMGWLYRKSPVFLSPEADKPSASASRLSALALLGFGLAVMLVGAALVVWRVTRLLTDEKNDVRVFEAWFPAFTRADPTVTVPGASGLAGTGQSQA
jgi:hypothetical protein